jgi:hypothetical protein
MSRQRNRVVITTIAPSAQRIRVQLVYAPLLAFAIYPPPDTGMPPASSSERMETDRDRELSPHGERGL